MKIYSHIDKYALYKERVGLSTLEKILIFNYKNQNVRNL